jgi:hypothetical protein
MPYLAPAQKSAPVGPTPPIASLSQQPWQRSPGQKESLSDRLRHVRAPLSFKYPLDLRWPPTDVGTAIIEVRMTGDLVLMTKKLYPALYVNNRKQLELQVTHEAHHAMGKLVSDNRYIFDPVAKQLTYRSMLVSQSTTPNMPAIAIGVEMGSKSPIPKLRAEIRIAKLEGSVDAFRYIALDMKFVVEITPKPDPKNPSSPPPVASLSNRSLSSSDSSQTRSPPGTWTRVLGVGLVATAGVLVIAALVDDFIPILGQADDVAAAMVAAGIATRGLACYAALIRCYRPLCQRSFRRR